jgi:hypothetical protein
MDTPATLLLAVHNHQPVGNFDHVFEKAFNQCYSPFLETLAEYPGVHMALHYSGCLLEWIEEHQPGHIDEIRKLVERGQVEILGGGYYEPILSAIPERDALLQIQTYSDHLEKMFGQRPAGIWLPERVWEPCLPRLLHRSGIQYSMVDDSHFLSAGMPENDIWGRFVTEREGHPLSLLPIDMKLRYWIPFREPEESIRYLKDRAGRNTNYTALYGDDGEKFGVWPGTREWVHERGWLKRFFKALQDNREWLHIPLIKEYLEHAPARGRVYIPPSSYEEMMGWALPAALQGRLKGFVEGLKGEGRWEDLAPLVHGAGWDNFLIKYPEANLLHKRMIRVSDKLAHAEDDGIEGLEEARRDLFRGQCNCAYWHGVFGGLYLNYLRHAVYERLIRADERIEKATNPSPGWLKVDKVDYDCDGNQEFIVENAKLGAYIHPAQGGSLFHLEYKPAGFCLSNVMGRRFEAYHEKIGGPQKDDNSKPRTIHERVTSKEPDLEKHLVYDRFPRYSFLEHFITEPIRVNELVREAYRDRGDFAAEPFQIEEVLPGKRQAWITLIRKGEVRLERGTFPLQLRKSYGFESRWSGMGVEYELTSLSNEKLECEFAVEMNFTLLAGDAEDRYYRINGERPEECMMKSAGMAEEVYSIALVDEAFGFHLEIFFKPDAVSVFRFPLETVSQSEAGFERTYQGSVIWASQPLKLSPQEKWQWQIILNLEKSR